MSTMIRMPYALSLYESKCSGPREPLLIKKLQFCRKVRYDGRCQLLLPSIELGIGLQRRSYLAIPSELFI